MCRSTVLMLRMARSHLGKALVGADGGAVVEGRGCEVGADHVDSVEASLGVDRILLESE
jgi:hypothetical protein